MIELTIGSFIGFLALAQAILLGLYVAIFYPKYSVSWVVVAILTSIVIALGHDLLLQSRLALSFPHILGLGPFSTYLIGPLIWLLVSKLVFPDKPLGYWNLLHLLPFGWQQITRLPHLLQSGEIKLAILQDYYSRPVSEMVSHSLSLNSLLELVSFYGHRFGYILFCLYYLHRHQKQLTHAVKPRVFSAKLLKWLLVSYILAWVLLRTCYYINPLASEVLANINTIHAFGLSSVAFGLAILLFKFPLPEIFSGQSTKKYQKSGLDTILSEKLLLQIEEIIESDKLYCLPDINQSIIAKRIGISAQLLSQIINSQTGHNFNDYINLLRIKHFKQLLESSNREELDMLTLAINSGFSSKATFYRVFKKHTSQTPTEYKNSF